MSADNRDKNPDLWDRVYAAHYAAAEGLAEDRRQHMAVHNASRAVAGLPFWSSEQVRQAVRLRIGSMMSGKTEPPEGTPDNP